MGGERDAERGAEGASEALAETVVSEAPPPEPASATPTLPRGASIGHFIVVDTIGAGAMGMVVQAYDPALDRKVALKLLRPGSWPGAAATEGRQRLLREAQAMAKLSHPNVVTAFEVGMFGEHVFLAMEYVGGKTLGAWIAERRRTWREIVDVFLQAGRGLAAAHRAGIVHRDFKPDNVLIASDGRVRVSDFGLASLAPVVAPAGADAAAGFEGDTPPNGTELPSSPPYAFGPSTMTRAGALIGTPAYMSPEQHKGEPADARADQFSYCVALYEALYGERPFEGKSYRTYARNAIAGAVREPPRGARVPGWIRRILVRGLSPDAASRFASMDELLAPLARDPVLVRKRIAIGAVIASLSGLALFGLARNNGAPALCRGAGEMMAGVWDARAAAAVEEAMLASGKPHARDTFARVKRILDAQAAEITAMRTSACEATRVRKEQSEQLLDLRIGCLDRRTTELRALVELYSGRVDATLLDNAVEAALSLAPVEACGDTQALLSAVPMPDDPLVRARILTTRDGLARADALARVGRYKEGLELAARAAADAKTIAWPPLLAEALAARAGLESKSSQPKAAQATWHEVAGMAARARDDALLAKAWVQLVHLIGYVEGRPAEVALLEEVAAAQVVRAGEPAGLLAELHNAQAAIRFTNAKYDEAVALFDRVLRDRKAALGDEHPAVASALANLAVAYGALGEYDKQYDAATRALALRERVLGPDHPLTGVSLQSVGIVLSTLRRDQEALASFERALAIREKVFGPDSLPAADSLTSIGLVLVSLDRQEDALGYQRRALAIRQKLNGPDHPNTADSHMNLGTLLDGLGRRDEAVRELEQAIAIREKLQGKDHPDVAGPLNNLALVLRKQGKYDEARAILDRVLAMREKSLGPDHPDTGSAVNNIGFLELQRERYDEADRWYRRAIAIFERKYGPTHPRTLDTLAYFGEVAMQRKRHDEGISAFERFLAGYATPDRIANANPNGVAQVKFALARSLRTAKRDPERQLALAREAREQLAKDGQHVESVEEIDAFLRSRP